MSAKTSSFEKDGKEYPTIELKPEGTAKFGFTFGVSKARLIVKNIDEIMQFVKDNEDWQV